MRSFDIFKNEPDVQDFTAGQVIFAEGEPGECMFAVLEGELVIVRGGKVLEVVTSGCVFGEMALIDKQPRSASAVAKTDGRLARITEDRFVRLVHQTPHFALQMMGVLVKRARYNLEC